MKKLNIKFKKRHLIFALLAWVATVGLVNLIKPLPKGLQVKSTVHTIAQDDVEFLTDLTYLDTNKKQVHKQVIFDRFLKLIDEAGQYILIDMFLFNTFTSLDDHIYRPITTEVTQHLLQKKQQIPDIKIDFITDPINGVYGGDQADELDQMQAAGINVIYTDLTKLRDSNPFYSSFWRTFLQWWGNAPRPGLLPHPFSQKRHKVSLRSYLALLNFKANHRKIIVADHHGRLAAMVMSANAHDSSSGHSNVAAFITGDFAKEVYSAEEAIARFSKGTLHPLPATTAVTVDEQKSYDVRLLTEGKIKSELIAQINHLAEDDRLSIALFYLSERKVLSAIIKAADRGVKVRLILDPNKDAFGHKKGGIPNRQSASTLVKKSKGRIAIRWYATHGEQFHTKLIITETPGQTTALLGSANLTRRNINNLNLESSVKLSCHPQDQLARQLADYYDRIWTNRDDHLFTTPYETYKDDSRLKKLLARFQEVTGLSTF